MDGATVDSRTGAADGATVGGIIKPVHNSGLSGTCIWLGRLVGTTSGATNFAVGTAEGAVVDFTSSDLVGAIVGTIVGDVVGSFVEAVVGEADGALVVRVLVGLADFTGFLEGFGAVVGLLVGRRADASKDIGTGKDCASAFFICCFSRRA